MYKRIVLKLSGEVLAGRAALAWMPARSLKLPARLWMCMRWRGDRRGGGRRQFLPRVAEQAKDMDR